MRFFFFLNFKGKMWFNKGWTTSTNMPNKIEDKFTNSKPHNYMGIPYSNLSLSKLVEPTTILSTLKSKRFCSSAIFVGATNLEVVLFFSFLFKFNYKYLKIVLNYYWNSIIYGYNQCTGWLSLATVHNSVSMNINTRSLLTYYQGSKQKHKLLLLSFF